MGKNIKPDKEHIAIFDFDGTLTYCDTLIPFIIYCIGLPNFILGILCLSPHLLKYYLKKISNHQLKSLFIKQFFSNLSESYLVSKGESFASNKLDIFTNPTAIKKLQYHLKRQHPTLIISASLELYLLPWSKKCHNVPCLSTQLEFINNTPSGNFINNNCYGKEKLKRLLASTNNLSQFKNIYVYGDSQGDQEILKVASHPYYKPFRSFLFPLKKLLIILQFLIKYKL